MQQNVQLLNNLQLSNILIKNNAGEAGKKDAGLHISGAWLHVFLKRRGERGKEEKEGNPQRYDSRSSLQQTGNSNKAKNR